MHPSARIRASPLLSGGSVYLVSKFPGICFQKLPTAPQAVPMGLHTQLGCAWEHVCTGPLLCFCPVSRFTSEDSLMSASSCGLSLHTQPSPRLMPQGSREDWAGRAQGGLGITIWLSTSQPQSSSPATPCHLLRMLKCEQGQEGDIASIFVRHSHTVDLVPKPWPRQSE